MRKTFTLTIVACVAFVSSLNAQTIATFAGSTSGYVEGTGASAKFKSPYGIAFEGGAAVVVADQGNYRVRKVYAYQSTSLLAGAGVSGNVNGTGASAQFGTLGGVARDGFNNTYISDVNFHVIKKITSGGVVTTVAGGTLGNADGTGAAAQFNRPYAIASDISGVLYVADTYNHTIRKITTAGVVTTLAGSTQGYADGNGAAAKFDFPNAIAVDGSGNVFVGDRSRIRKITPSGDVTTFAGGTAGYLDGTGVAARFADGIGGIAIDASGNLFVADTYNYRIRKVSPTAVVTTYAGTGVSGDADGDVSVATFSEITGIAVDNTGIVYFSDFSNNKIKRIFPATAPSVSGVSLQNLTYNSATISYYLNANNGATSSIIKYGLAANSLTSQVNGFSTTGNSPNAGTGALAGLQANTTYYYQIEATNSAGTTTTSGTTLSFTTHSLPPPDQLITRYNFDNSYNNINGNTPFETNAGTSFGADRNGNLSKALYINYNGTKAVIPNLPYQNSPRTVSIWVKLTTSGAYNFIYNYGNGLTSNGSLLPNSTSVTNHGGAQGHTVATATALNTWYHFVFTFDGTTSKIYKDGTLLSSFAKTLNTVSNSDYFRLGLSENGGTFNFNGAVDDLCIFNYALSASEVSELYNNNTLPVTLTSFTAKVQNNSAVLNWETASETNNSHFVVKRSNDGVHFTEIGKVDAKSAEGASYQFTDSNPASGTNYYQLVQVDLDGKTTSLATKSLNFNLAATRVNAYPNPTSDKLEVNFATGLYQQVKVFDGNGKLVQTLAIGANQSSVQISLANQAKGVYILSLEGKEKSYTQKIIKQ
jgi:hypothetical protein